MRFVSRNYVTHIHSFHSKNIFIFIYPFSRAMQVPVEKLLDFLLDSLKFRAQKVRISRWNFGTPSERFNIHVLKIPEPPTLKNLLFRYSLIYWHVSIL
jgi:hypothetical protein